MSAAAAVHAEPVFTLPRLAGRGYRLFQVVWLAALVLTIVAMAAGNYRSYVRSSERPFSHVGLGWYEDRGEIRLRDPVSGEAVAAGIRRGDRIVAIDGRRVGSGLEWAASLDRRLKGPEGSSVALTIARDGDGSKTVRLTRTRRNLDAAFAGSGLTAEAFRWMTIVTNILPDLFILLAACLLFRGRREETVGALLSLSLLLSIATGGGAWAFWESASLAFIRAAVATIAVVGLIAALLAFPHGRIDRRWGGSVLLLAAAWGVASMFLPPSPLHGLPWTAAILAAVVLMARSYRRLPDGRERQQIRWAMLGFSWGAAFILLSALVGALERFVLGDHLGADIWAAFAELVLGSFGIICFAGGLLVSLLRYRLYDVDAVMSRSAAYGLMTIGFVAVFAGSQKVIETLGETFLLGGSAPLSGAVAAAAGAAVVVPLHDRVHRWAEGRFRKALLHLRRDLPDCLADLRETEGLTAIAGEVLERAAAGVHAVRGALVVGERVEGALGTGKADVEAWWARAASTGSGPDRDCDRSDPDFPMRVPLRARHAQEASPLGWLLLGPRPDGSFYGSDERDALTDVADAIARAIRVVQLRDAREARLARRLEERITALEGRLSVRTG